MSPGLFRSGFTRGITLYVLAIHLRVLLACATEIEVGYEDLDQMSLLQIETVKVPPTHSTDSSTVEQDISRRQFLQVPFEPGTMVPEWKLLGHQQPAMLLHVPYNHVAQDVPYSNLMEQVLTFPERKPRELNVIMATLKTWSADATVQVLQRPQNGGWSFDWKRSFAFALFGFVYVGVVQWFLYVTVLTWLFPDAVIFANEPWYAKFTDRAGQMDVVGQILVDNFVFSCFIYFPAFYTIKGLLQEKGPLFHRIYAGLNKYRTNVVTDNLTSWALWFPCDIGIFACPMYMRMPLEHTVSFAWTMIISFMRGSGTESGKTSQKAEQITEK